MFIAVLILAMLILVYYFGKIKIPISAYAMIVTFPYKSIIAIHCPWLDTVFELALMVEFLLLLAISIKKRRRIRLELPVLFFVVGIVIDTVLYSVSNDNIQFLITNKDTRFYIGTYILIFLLANKIKSNCELLDLCRTFTINGILLVGFGLVSWMRGISESLYAFDNKNIFAMQICLDVFLCMYIQHLTDSKVRKKRYQMLTVFFVVALLLTKSSAAILGCIVGGCIVLLRKLRIYNRRLFKVMVFVMVIVGIWSVDITVTNSIKNSYIISLIMKSKGYYDDTRVYIWGEALERFKEHWFVGIGADVFRTTKIAYSFATHNDYLMFLVDYGIIGFSVFVIFSGIFLKTVFEIADKRLFEIGLAITFGLYFYILTHNYVNYIIFWSAIEIVLCTSRLSQHEQIDRRNA